MWNDVLVQRWGGDLERIQLSADGRTLLQHDDGLPDLRCLDVQVSLTLVSPGAPAGASRSQRMHMEIS